MGNSYESFYIKCNIYLNLGVKTLFNKIVIIGSILLLAIFTMSLASASPDLNESATLTYDVDAIGSLNVENSIGSTISVENDDLESKLSEVENKEIISSDENDVKVSSVISGNSKIKSDNSKTFYNIQKDINDAPKGSVIKLSGTYVGEGKSIKITKDITIQGLGNGATLNAKKLSRIFHISGNSKVTLKNLKLINALEKERKGGAIYTTASNLNIYKCNFKENGALSAGDIYIAGGECNIKSSTFKKSYDYCRDPEEDMLDGYTFPEDYSSIINKGISKFYRCSFEEMAHVIYSSNNSSFNKCTFRDNSFSVLTLKGSNIIKNCKFTNNFAESYPDTGVHGISPYYYVVEIKSGKTTILNCNFIKNTARVIHNTYSATCKIVDSKFSGNYRYQSVDYKLIHITILNKGKLYITKNHKTTQYGRSTKNVIFGDSLKTTQYASPSKFTVKYNSKKTVNIKYYGSYYYSKAVLKVFTGDKYKTFKADKSKNGLFKFKIAGVSVGTHKFKFVLNIPSPKYYVKYGTLKIYKNTG